MWECVGTHCPALGGMFSESFLEELGEVGIRPSTVSRLLLTFLLCYSHPMTSFRQIIYASKQITSSKDQRHTYPHLVIGHYGIVLTYSCAGMTYNLSRRQRKVTGCAPLRMS